MDDVVASVSSSRRSSSLHRPEPTRRPPPPPPPKKPEAPVERETPSRTAETRRPTTRSGQHDCRFAADQLRQRVASTAAPRIAAARAGSATPAAAPAAATSPSPSAAPARPDPRQLEAERATVEARAANAEAAEAGRSAEAARAEADRVEGRGSPAELDRARRSADRAERDAREAREDAVEASDAALAAQARANESAVEAERELPFPDAVGVVDGRALASAKPETQRAILGAPAAFRGADVDAVRVREAQSDAARVDRALRDQGPMAASVRLADAAEARGRDPAWAAAFVDATRDSREAIARDLVEHRDSMLVADTTVWTLTRATEALGPEHAAELARPVAEAMPEHHNDGIESAVQLAVERGSGVQFGAALFGELEARGKHDTAFAVARRTTDGIEHLRSEFEDAKKDADEAQLELAHLSTTYGGLLTPEQRERAAADFDARHRATFERFEAAGERYASTLEGSAALFAPDGALARVAEGEGQHFGRSLAARDMREEAERTLRSFPDLAQTRAGVEATTQALMAGGRGRPSFLDQLPAVSNRMSEDERAAFRESSRVALVESAGAAAVANPAHSAEVLAGLEAQGALFDEDPQTFDLVLSSLGTIRQATSERAVSFALDRLGRDTARSKLFGSESRLGQSLMGFGAILGAVNTARGVANWQESSLLERADTILSGSTAATGGASTVLAILGKSGAVKALGRFAGGLGLVGAAIDVKNFVDKAGEGDWLGAAAAGTSALGTGLLAAAALSSAVPGFGTVVAIGLLATSVGLNQWIKSREANKYEGPAEEFLKAAGVDDETAKQLSNHGGDGLSPGRTLEELARQLGLSGPEFVQRLGRLDGDQMRDIVERSHNIELDDEGRPRAHRDPGEGPPRRHPRMPRVPRPRSVQDLTEYVREFYPELLA